jgi:uncharacterized protein (TIGR03086 family)
LGDDPVDDFERARAETLSTFGEEGVIEKTGPSLGIAFSDQLLHGWDLAKATGQDSTLDAALAEDVLAFARQTITDASRAPRIGPEVVVASGAPITDQLVGYLGRRP